MIKISAFRKKNDQFEIDSLRNALNDIYDFNSQSKQVEFSYTNQNSLSPILFDEYIFRKWEADYEIKRFKNILKLIIEKRNKKQCDISLYSTYSPENFKNIVIGYYSELEIIEKQLQDVKNIISYLQDFLKYNDDYSWNNYSKLRAKLTFQLIEYTENILPIVRSVSLYDQILDKARKTIISIVSNLVKNILVKLKRDIRECYRTIIQIHFKNMDDNSGESILCFKIKSLAFLYEPLNYSYHEKKNGYHQTYQQAA